ncbi:hypothetical protein [Fluviicola sp.]|uniref:hypothetical protein n=1 Tax=Fluviicola sp. TaxID=1917219 RepID=UPI0031D760A4
MKKGLIICAFAIGAVGAFAFAPAKAAVKSGDTTRHWFDAQTGAYLGQKLESQQQSDCGEPVDIDCAYGYNGISGTPGNEQPVGSVMALTLKATN